MPDSGSAPTVTFTRSVAGYSGTDAIQQGDAAGRTVLSIDLDEQANDLATAINNRLRKDGANLAADIDFNGFKAVDIGNASARTHFAAYGQVQDSSSLYAATSSGTDTITATLTPAITAYVASFWLLGASAIVMQYPDADKFWFVPLGALILSAIFLSIALFETGNDG